MCGDIPESVDGAPADVGMSLFDLVGQFPRRFREGF
jgi:hypothetical protein